MEKWEAGTQGQKLSTDNSAPATAADRIPFVLAILFLWEDINKDTQICVHRLLHSNTSK